MQLFALLRNHEQSARLLVQLMASAPRMSEAVIHRAHVMDGLIDPAFADDVTRRDVLIAKVDAFLAEARSYEEIIDRARIIGQEQKFLIAAGLLSGTVTRARARRAVHRLGRDPAQPPVRQRARRVRAAPWRAAGRAVGLLAFGKMASREMTATSDLDFILLYDAPEDESDGDKPLSTSHYYARLTQRLVAAISAPTAEGVLYEADMRLRPSGNAGPLATSLPGFVAYHRDNAWTWEHLALSRARVIAADASLGSKSTRRLPKSCRARAITAKTIDDVVTMRALMAKERPPRHPFDLKLAPGGLVDLEFIAQSAQLVAGATIGLPQALTARVLSRLGRRRPGAGRAAAGRDPRSLFHGAAGHEFGAGHPFKEESWTDAFKDLLPGSRTIRISSG